MICKQSKNEVIYEVKGSKFIGQCFAISDPKEVNEYLERLRSEHSKATHICYAYRLGGVERLHDDGEPSGTAGKPLLNCLQKMQVENTLIVAVRYFGGVKLGAGGLVRAYTACATHTLREAETIELEEYNLFSIKLPYENVNGFENALQRLNCPVFDKQFGENVQVLFGCVKVKRFEKEMYNKWGQVTLMGKEWLRK